METHESECFALINLLTAIAQVALGPPADLVAFIRQRLSTVAMPSPWEAWTLVSLVHCRATVWAKEIIYGHLLGAVSGFRKALRQKRRLTGDVPEHPEWVFDLDGLNGTCLLVNRVTNEQIGRSGQPITMRPILASEGGLGLCVCSGSGHGQGQRGSTTSRTSSLRTFAHRLARVSKRHKMLPGRAE